MAEVTPELLSQLTDYLHKRERGEIPLLSFFYKEVFGREIKISCPVCVEEAAEHLKRVKQRQILMENYKWVGGDKKCIIRENGMIVVVNSITCSDRLAEKLLTIEKYSHLVEPVEKKVDGELNVSEDITSTLTEVKKEEKEVKKRRKKPASK